VQETERFAEMILEFVAIDARPGADHQPAVAEESFGFGLKNEVCG